MFVLACNTLSFLVAGLKLSRADLNCPCIVLQCLSPAKQSMFMLFVVLMI